MSNPFNLKVGSIIHEMESNIDHRVIYENSDCFVTILIHSPYGKAVINEWYSEMIRNLLENREIVIHEPKYDNVFDEDNLSLKEKELYLRNKDIVEVVRKAYGPCYFNLANRKKKPCIQELSKKYEITSKSVLYIVKSYLMSGLDSFSLLPKSGKKSKSNLNYEKKTGRPPMFEAGMPLTNDLREIFDDCCKHYLSGREKSYTTTYDWMLTKYFTVRVEMQSEDGVIIRQKLLPIDQRPTQNQMETYIRNNTSTKERSICKTSKREYRNNERMLRADNLFNVQGPGDLFEMDEVEMDVSIVSEADQTKVIGRPIVHAMVDVYSRMIAAVSVSLENNSVLGFTNCLLNLGEDNKQLCRRFGLELNDGLWDINVLPNRIRSDRGSEYRSKEVKRICNELDITLELVPPAMGSLKGQVEQLFHQYHSVQNDLIEGKGLITKRHDSNHHKNAILTLDDIWVFVINQTIAHNMMTMAEYPMTSDMVNKSVHPIPLEIWDYGCKKFGAPRLITNLDQFEYSIRREVTARITRKGIEWNGLFYIANDPWLAEQITMAKGNSVPLKCRLDERNVGSLWFIAGNRLVKAGLNQNRAGNFEFNGKSLRAYEEFKAKKKELIKEKAQEDQEIRCARRMGMEATMNDAVRIANNTAPSDSKTKNIRKNRKEESITFMESNTIGSRLNTEETPPMIPMNDTEPEVLAEPEPQNNSEIVSFDEALAKIMEKM